MNSSKSKQGRLWGRPLTIKEEKEKKKKESSGYPFHRITASMVKCYKNCPKLFYYQYILKKRLSTKSVQLAFGGAFHKGVEAYYNDKDPVEEFKSEFKMDGIRDITDEKFLDNKKDGIRLMEVWKDQVEKIHAEYDIDPGGQSELKFESFWLHPFTYKKFPVMVNGIFDRVTNSHEILEFKTSSKPYKQDDVNVREQAAIYIYSYYRNFKVWPKAFYYIVFIKNRINNPIQVLKTERNKDDIAQLFEMMELLLNNVKGRTERDFPYGEGFLHKYCDCRRYEEMFLL